MGIVLDLVKAFDHVPRELLWLILTKIGVPKKLVELVRALHNEFKVKVTVDDVISTITCVTGVKQGNILGPVLFIFFIETVMITWNATNNATYCIFYSKNDAKQTGRSYRTKGKKVLLLDSEYADYTAILFDKHEDLTNGVNIIVTYVARF